MAPFHFLNMSAGRDGTRNQRRLEKLNGNLPQHTMQTDSKYKAREPYMPPPGFSRSSASQRAPQPPSLPGYVGQPDYSQHLQRQPPSLNDVIQAGDANVAPPPYEECAGASSSRIEGPASQSRQPQREYVFRQRLNADGGVIHGRFGKPNHPPSVLSRLAILATDAQSLQKRGGGELEETQLYTAFVNTDDERHGDGQGAGPTFLRLCSGDQDVETMGDSTLVAATWCYLPPGPCWKIDVGRHGFWKMVEGSRRDSRRWEFWVPSLSPERTSRLRDENEKAVKTGMEKIYGFDHGRRRLVWSKGSEKDLGSGGSTSAHEWNLADQETGTLLAVFVVKDLRGNEKGTLKWFEILEKGEEVGALLVLCAVLEETKPRKSQWCLIS